MIYIAISHCLISTNITKLEEVIVIKIDTHSHIIPNNIIHLIKHQGDRWDAEIQSKDGQPWVIHKQGYQYPLLSQFHDPSKKQSDMAAMGIDFTVLSPAPPLFMYWIDPEDGASIARQVNEGCSEFVQNNPMRFRSLATVPMQKPELAVKELEYAKALPGLCGVEIGTSIEGRTLDDPVFGDFFSLCEELGWPIFLHPYYVGDKKGFSNYYLTNLIGNPLDTTLGAASLIFGGILDRHPKLRILLAHGGGYLPYQIGRLDHGYDVRKESRTCEQKPSAYLPRLFYDSITFNSHSLSFLIQMVGDKQVVLGTDYPFDMGETDPVNMLDTAVASNEVVHHQVSYTNARSLFGDVLDEKRLS